jgi:hypothetical protein
VDQETPAERKQRLARERGRRWRERNRERYLAQHAAAERRRRAAGKVDDREWRKAWRAAHPDAVAAMSRRKTAKHYAAHRDEELARSARFFAANPTYRQDRRERACEQERAYRARHPEMRSDRRRRVAKAGIALVIRVDADHCGVCLGPLIEERRHPDPLATSVGHEPPLVIAKRDGWLVVVERPEHLRCNLQKGDRPDGRHAATSSTFASIHEVIAAAAA